ncbi:MAG: MaoC family dehydratase [Mesorhizobium sp.]|nr:MaoC family dehydratase [Mesorhizobium sp.]MBN9245343.1 MaoC family dehydratase [Mesorhizobium sp.]
MSVDFVSRSLAGVGDRLPVVVRTVDQQAIDAYARASGDFNPIHVDPGFARQGPFGRTIAHGLMTLAFVAEMLNDWSGGAFDETGEIDIAFTGPVFAGDTVEVTGAVEETVRRDGVECARIKLVVRAGDRQILAGHAIQPIKEPED